MARQLSGVVSWMDHPIYSGKTPITWKHFEELSKNIKLIHEDLEYHKSLETYEAHKAVSLTQPGFITPEIVKEIDKIADRLSDLYYKAALRVPSGIIVMYDGNPSAPPDKWVWCNGQNNTPDTRGKYILGGSSTATYPLHSSTSGSTNINDVVSNAGGMISHSHNFLNCWCCRNGNPDGWTYRAPYGRNLQLNDWDWDNSSVYYYDYFDYAGGNASYNIGQLLPKTIKVPYIMRTYDALKDYTITVAQPKEGGRIYVDGAIIAKKTVKKNTTIKITMEVDEGYSVVNLNVNGESRGTPCWVVVYGNTNISGTVGANIVNLRVNQSPFLKTYLNGEYTSSKNVRYGSKVDVTSDSAPGVEVVGYNIQGRGWSGNVQPLSLESNEAPIAVQSRMCDPDPIIDVTIPFSESLEVRSKAEKTVCSSVPFEIEEDGVYRVRINPKIYSDFYGYRGSDAEMVLETYIDGQVESTNTFTYLEDGELEVDAVYSATVLSKGKHTIMVTLKCTAGTATLTGQIIGGSVKISEMGVVANGSE